MPDFYDFKGSFTQIRQELSRDENFMSLSTIFEDAEHKELEFSVGPLEDKDGNVAGMQIMIDLPDYEDGQTFHHVTTKNNEISIDVWKPSAYAGRQYTASFNINSKGTIYKTKLRTFNDNYDLSKLEDYIVGDILFVQVPIHLKGKKEVSLCAAREKLGFYFYGHELYGKPVDPDYTA